MSDPSLNAPEEGSKLAALIGAKARRKLNARRSAQGVWFGLGMLGLIGWSVVVPMLLGAALGLWLDRHHPGRRDWTLALMMAGLGFGCLNAWRWMDRQERAMRDEPEDPDV